VIVLKDLTWSNCFSYGANNTLNLSEERITQILGTNGVGKSSIPLILEEVLFNKNSKGIKKADIANRLLDGGYSINLKFQKDADEYEIDLIRKTTIKVRFYKNGEDISSHTATNTYKTIEDVLGIDFKTFSQVVYQNASSSLNFLTATDSNRKKFLIDLLGLEQYVNIFEIFKAASKEVEIEYSKIEGKISSIEKWLETNKLIDTTPRPLENLPEISENDQDQLSHLMAELKNISVTNRKISQNNKYIELIKSIDINKIRELPDTEFQSYDEHLAKVGEITSTIKSSQTMIDKLERLSNECPTCQQKITEDWKVQHIFSERKKVQEQEARKAKIEAQIAEIQRNNKAYQLKQQKTKEWESLFTQIDRFLPTALIDEEELSQSIAELKHAIAEQQKKLQKIEKYNQEASAYNARIQVISEQTTEFETELANLQSTYSALQNRRANMEILKKAFSTNGLIAYKIENLVKELETVTGIYLSELSDGRFTLNFSVNNDKLNVEITDNGNVVDISALSSGELARVNTATLLGIRKLMNSLSSNQINVLFLDEVMNVLDEQGREKLVEVLINEDLNTYIVSHQWSHPLLAKIEVCKTDGISEISK